MTNPFNWQTNQASNSLQQQDINTNHSSYHDRPPLKQQQQPSSPVLILPRPHIPINSKPSQRILQPNPYPPNTTYQPDRTITMEQGKTENQRNRTLRACDACRRKKTKCSTNGPGNSCSYCQSIKIQCTYTESGKKRGPPRGYTDTLDGRLKRMEKMLTTMMDQPLQTKPAKKRKLNEEIPSATVHKKTSDITIYELPVEHCVNDINATYDISSISTELRTQYMGDRNPLQFLGNKIRIKKNFVAHMAGLLVKKVGNTLVFKHDDEEGKNGNQRFLEKLRLIKPGETIKGINDWIFKVSGLDKSTSDSLLKIYFGYIHSKLPILNKQLFLRQYRGEFNEYPSAPLLNAMYGAAARYLEVCNAFGEPMQLDNNVEMKNGRSEHFFDCLTVYLTRNFSPCVSAVQAVLIAQTNKFGLDAKVGNRWMLSSFVIRMAQDLGLNRSVQNWNIPVSEKETRMRVWWSVYMLDRWAAASTGRPLAIFDDDCDVEYPDENADWEEIMDIPARPEDDEGPRFPSLRDENSTCQERVPIYRPFTEFIKLSEILGDVLKGLYTPLAKEHSVKHGSNAIVSYIDKTLSDWRDALPEDLKFNKMNEKDESSLSKPGLMYISYCALLILLHRPFIVKEGGPSTRSGQSSLSICTSAATRCIDVALNMHFRDYFFVSWGFIIYPVFTAAVIHINNATSPDRRLADDAMINLVKSSKFIQKIALTSPGAGQLHYVLDQLLKLRDITTGTDKVLEKFALKHGPSKLRVIPETTLTAEAPYKRRSETPLPEPNTHATTAVNTHYPPVSEQQQPADEHLVQTEESYSLQQFGLSMDTTTMHHEFFQQPQDTLFGPVERSMPVSFENTYPLEDQTLFRNRPDNAFWSVPSSIVIDDWLAYLLPQQSQAESSDWHQHRWM